MWKSAPNYGTDWRRYFGNRQHFTNATDEFTSQAIQRVYRRRALRLHPDKNPSDRESATAAFKRLGYYKELANRELARPAAPDAAKPLMTRRDLALLRGSTSFYIHLLLNRRMSMSQKVGLASRLFDLHSFDTNVNRNPAYHGLATRRAYQVYIRFSKTRFLWRIIVPRAGAVTIDATGKAVARPTSDTPAARKLLDDIRNMMLDSYAASKLRIGIANRNVPYAPRAAPARKLPKTFRWPSRRR